jgi:hypothetical protein
MNQFAANFLDNQFKSSNQFKRVYNKNSIITVNFDLSPKTNVFGKLIARTIGDNDLPEDDAIIDDYSDYKFDIAIILDDYYEKEQKYKIMLGTGKIILVEFKDIQSVIREHPHNKEYFGRNPKYVKQFNKEKDEWEPVDEKTLMNDKEKYRTYQYNLLFQKMQAKLPPTYHYKLPQKNEICKLEPSAKEKYSINMIVIIKPVEWQSDQYEYVVAIILDCNYETKNYTVIAFDSASKDTIPKENIIKTIRCPENGEYFGKFQNHSMRFNGDANMWEHVSLKDDDKDIEQWKMNKKNIQNIQQQQDLKRIGGKYTRRRKNKKTKKVKKTRLTKISSRSLALR